MDSPRNGESTIKLFLNMALLAYSKLRGKRVREGKVLLGRVVDIVLELDSGKVLGFLLRENFWSVRKRYIPESCILDIGADVEISTSSEKGEPTHYEKPYSFFAMSVFTETGVFLGHIKDFLLDTASLKVIQIDVEEKMVFLYPYQNYLIHYTDILEVRGSVIIVRDSVAGERIKSPYWLSAKKKLLAPGLQTMRIEKKV